MAVGKNPRLTKGKKGAKKKTGDPFMRKEWYDIKAPGDFANRNCGKTLVSKTQGTKIASEGLKGRVLELNLADLNANDGQAHMKIKLCVEEIQGKNCLTDFHGLCLTRDKLCSMIQKWQTMIEMNTDVKTVDGYVVRIFVIAFTKRQQSQVKTNCYAQSAQVRKIRKMIADVLEKESKVPLRELVKKLIAESIESDIVKRSAKPSGIFPLKDVQIRKVKIVKKPKFDITKLMELHQDTGGGEDTGAAFGRPEAEEAQNTLTADVAAMDADE